MKDLYEDRTIKEAYADLAGAICAQAVKDLKTAYRAVMAGKKTREDSTVQTLEKFFRSEWFTQLIGGTVNGDMVIQEVQKQCRRRHRDTST